MRLPLIASLLAALALPACADGLKLTKTGKSRAEQLQRQQRLMDSRLAGQYQQSARLKEPKPKPQPPREVHYHYHYHAAPKEQ